MKKVVAVISIFLVGCGYAPMNNINSIIITDIEQLSNTSCNYYGRGDVMRVFTWTSNKFKFTDVCGKFQIGDTLNIVKQ